MYICWVYVRTGSSSKAGRGGMLQMKWFSLLINHLSISWSLKAINHSTNKPTNIPTNHRRNSCLKIAGIRLLSFCLVVRLVCWLFGWLADGITDRSIYWCKIIWLVVVDCACICFLIDRCVGFVLGCGWLFVNLFCLSACFGFACGWSVVCVFVCVCLLFGWLRSIVFLIVRLSARVSIYSFFVRLCLFVCPSIRLSVRSFDRLFVRSFVRLPVYSFVRSFDRLIVWSPSWKVPRQRRR